MRIARFEHGGSIRYGRWHDDGLAPFTSDPFTSSETATESSLFPAEEVRLLAPVHPGKVLAVGRNYAEHAAELGNEVPGEPLVFLKPGSSVIGPNETVVRPSCTEDLHHEAELAVVLSERCRNLPPERVPEHVLGYTCANDVTARDLQGPDRQWWRAKGSDTFCPLGPWIETDPGAGSLSIGTTVNGETRQSGRTEHMVHGVSELVAHISSAMTLEPGDVVLTGTPAGVGPLRPGDTVTVFVEGIGELTNTVESAS